jgi:hypothetical protein
MDMNDIINGAIAVLILPLQALLIPFDALLAQIPGIGIIPATLTSVLGYIGSLPSTLVSLSGINPIIWNALFLTFVLYFTSAPVIQFIKKVWAWVRL